MSCFVNFVRSLETSVGFREQYEVIGFCHSPNEHRSQVELGGGGGSFRKWDFSLADQKLRNFINLYVLDHENI